MTSAMNPPMPRLSEHLTHKANLKQTRYGWLRLTPAHSVHLVSNLLDGLDTKEAVVLDSFCGTGTTALVCAERGISADTTDINPFLIWLAAVKTRAYSAEQIAYFRAASRQVAEAIADCDAGIGWLPPLHQIEKWWEESTLCALSRAQRRIRELAAEIPAPVRDLLQIVFCRTMIERANVSFGHQSMSFKKAADTLALFTEEQAVVDTWEKASQEVGQAAQSPVRMPPRALLLDARHLTQALPRDHYACVITSPPYPNRMSYIRELRPYMYWLGYLQDGREAGELDWQAIGGTWGCATSLVGKWVPNESLCIPYTGFEELLARIARHSPLLSRYVHKYFYDMTAHIAELFTVVRPGGTAHYIVGNSKFYDVLLPVEQIFAALFASAGFARVTIQTIRKRTSKKELYEYIVSAHKL